LLFVFFFQAEDGIRDRTVTGVQTCALPIFEGGLPIMSPHLTPEQIVDVMVGSDEAQAGAHLAACAECATRLEAERHRLATFKERSEERRVGKDGRRLWSSVD